MDIWIIRNGEKTGPIHDYEIRHKIEDGQLDPATPAWHEGLAAWMPLGEIDLFKREFQLTEPYQSPLTVPETPLPPTGDLPPPVPQQQVIGRRFWARWLDLSLFAGIWWFTLWATGRDIRATMTNDWAMFPFYVPWFILETLLIHHFGATPGKWLLGLKVVNLDGSPLSLAEASRRSARVLFIGIGFGWYILTYFCQVLSYFTTLRLGSPLWDHVGGHKVLVESLRPARVALHVALFFCALTLQMIVLFPYILEAAAEESPEFKEQLEKNSHWHLPKRP